jgi:ParB/RepB/Spo0J family partition protein
MTGQTAIRKDAYGKGETFFLLPEQIRVDDSNNGRYVPATDESIQDLAEDITEHGQLQPVLVRYAKSDDDDLKYELVYGFRRVKAIKQANLTAKQPLFVRAELTDTDTPLLSNILENMKRDGTTALDDAQNIASLMESGWKVEKIAKLFNRSKAWVYSTKSLLDLPDDLKARVADGLLSATAAVDLVSAPEEIQKKAVEEGVKSVQDVRDITRYEGDEYEDSEDGEAKPEKAKPEKAKAKTEKKKGPGRPKKEIRAASRKELYRVILMMSEQSHPQLQAIGALLLEYADGKVTEAGVQRKLKKYGRDNPGEFESPQDAEDNEETQAAA